jgi:hypothetical protein
VIEKATSLILAGLVGLFIGVAVTGHKASEVDQFNSGFSDSKLDDCQQGFSSACEWLSAK